MQTFRLNFVFFSLYLISWVIEYFIIFKVQNYLLGTISLYFPMLIFIPHGIRVIGSMVYGPKIFLGLLTAHLVTGYFFLEDLTMILILSTLSVVAAYIAVYLVFKKFNLNSDDIVVNKIILIAIISSILNSMFNIVIKGNEHVNFYNFIGYGVGDLIGTLIVFYVLIQFFKTMQYKI